MQAPPYLIRLVVFKNIKKIKTNKRSKFKQGELTMVETIRGEGDQLLAWHYCDMVSDLSMQGGFNGVKIHPSSVRGYGYDGVTKKGTKFQIFWIKNLFLQITLSQHEQELIDAYSKVVEYRPFCSYHNDDGITYEWAKKDANERFAYLLNIPDPKLCLDLRMI